MHTLKKPIWCEGIILTQQHFQQWDDYIERSHRDQMRLLHPYFWGIRTLEIDEEALHQGCFRIKTCEAIFPSGPSVFFKAQSSGELCSTLESIAQENITVFLGLPYAQGIAGLKGYEQKNHCTQWRASYEMVCDHYDVDRTQEILFALPQLTLLNQTQERNGYDTLKIAEIKRVNTTDYNMTSWIPPVMNIGANSTLMEMLGRTVEMLEAKMKGLSSLDSYGQGQGHLIQENLWASVIQQSLPLLKTFQATGLLHPYCLYQEYVRLIGGLQGINLKNVLTLPAYQHTDLKGVFQTLNVQLQQILHHTLARCVRLGFVRRNRCLYITDHIDPKLFVQHDFYLAVCHQGEETQWVKKWHQQIKIASPSTIHHFVESAISAIGIHHLRHPPDYVPLKADYEYFILEAQGEYWKKIVEEKALALFVPHEFCEAQLELFVLPP